MKRVAVKRTFWQKFRLTNTYYRRTGFYRFIIGNLLKVLIGLGIIIAALLILNAHFDLEAEFLAIAESVNPIFVFILFYVSESILGLIPPDFFIAWSKSGIFENYWLIVILLSVISYAGGVTAYKLGELSLKSKKISGYIERKYAKNMKQIQKWGGIVIVVAALFPLPFAMITLLAGMLKYDFKKMLLFGSTRVLRFVGYALVIFHFMGKM